MRLTSFLDRLQRRRPALGFPLAVIYKYIDDTGNYLAALIAYYAFVSLFPLLLLLSTILGWVLVGHPDLQQRVLDSALHQFPVVGDQLATPRELSGGVVGVIIAILVATYGGLGVAQATQHAMNTAWRVPHTDRPNPVMARLRSVVLLVMVAVTLIGTTALSAMAGSTLGPIAGAVALAGSLLLNAGMFIVVFRVATTQSLSTRDVLPGAIAAAVIWQLLQSFGVVYVQHVVKNATATNSVFALVLGLLAFLYLSAVAVVLCVELNVVRVEKLYPRSLLTPFTEDVELTRGDREAYTTQATAQRAKEAEDIDVSFDDSATDHSADPDSATEDRT
jgi:membrane protein